MMEAVPDKILKHWLSKYIYRQKSITYKYKTLKKASLHRTLYIFLSYQGKLFNVSALCVLSNKKLTRRQWPKMAKKATISSCFKCILVVQRLPSTKMLVADI